VDGAAVLLMTDSTRWDTAAATDGTVTALEDAQLAVGEGPSVEAYLASGPVLVPDLQAAAARWPIFAASAPTLIRAFFSFPLQIGAVRLGVLDLYRTTAGPLNQRALADALRLADLAATALVHEPIVTLIDEADQLPAFTGTGREVDQATGMVSVHLGVGMAVAYARLRGYAFTSGRPVAEVARSVVDGDLRLDGEGRLDQPER
jgi:transcriptional regulator with GAF, ATPase, and Fis domain